MSFIEKDNNFLSFFFRFARYFCVFFFASFSFFPFAAANFSIGFVDQKGPWFEYSLDPGASVSGRVRVLNLTDSSGDFLLYPVDAHVNWDNGAFAPEGYEHERKFVGQWVSLSQKTVLLSGGQKRDISFTLHVPEGAQSGKYAGSIMMQPIPESFPAGSGDLQVSTRVGARIYVSVGGSSVPHVASEPEHALAPQPSQPESKPAVSLKPVQPVVSQPVVPGVSKPDFADKEPFQPSAVSQTPEPVFQVIPKKAPSPWTSRLFWVQWISRIGLLAVLLILLVQFLVDFFRKNS